MPNSRPADADPGLLDDPIWHALTGPHRRFAIASERSARTYRYRVDVAPFAALGDVADLSRLARARRTLRTPRTCGTGGPGGDHRSAGLDGGHRVPGRADDRSARWTDHRWRTRSCCPAEQKGCCRDGRLAELTRPGPFAASTVELGGYLGVRREGRLVAMAGRRLHLPGWIEISAVCTHPDHRGQGLSRLLIAGVEEAIRQEGHRAFLHVLHENTRAIDIYRGLGFTTRADMTMTVVRSES